MIADHNFGPPSKLQTDQIPSTSTWSEPNVRYDHVFVSIDHYQIRVFGYHI